MGSFLSSLAPGIFSMSNDVGLVVYTTIDTNIPNVTSVRVHPAGSLIVVGNDTGSIALYRIADVNHLCHRFSLTYEYGGVSEICWIGHDYVAIGTTRGRLILFKLEGDGRRLYESSHVIAHGDGAAQVAVDSLAYDLKTKCVVSVGDGKKSVRMWDHAEDGSLKEKAQAISTTAYSIPRYVTFFREGQQLLVAFLERPVIQTFTINPFAFAQELRLELDEDHYIGNALILETSGKLAIYSLKFGCCFFDLSTMTRVLSHSPQSQKCNAECSQALASLRDGTYVVSAWGQSSIMIVRASDGKHCGSLKVRRGKIRAIDSRPGQEDLLVASSLTDDGLSTLTIWSNKLRMSNASTPM
ncbi:WD40-repeat-containing domain protein [Crepidotus variabilis]|uniref:WD40-repeat-containing domain protein n=1 Tax=Crepidotus variabilis TaxID=179855 RepID=A0A9P6EMG4_9AGAR|nr:WD40-repeat-containing domain protein [Crepidotus variabilis]